MPPPRYLLASSSPLARPFAEGRLSARFPERRLVSLPLPLETDARPAFSLCFLFPSRHFSPSLGERILRAVLLLQRASSMPCCCAYNCSKRPEDGYAVFMISQGKRDGLRTSQWIHKISRKTFIPRNNRVVCDVECLSHSP